MENLKSTSKITKATLKAFIKRNVDNIYTKCCSDFNGMTDCVELVKDNFKKVNVDLDVLKGNHEILKGVYLVGSSRDYFTIFDENGFYGIEVNNCCGNSIVAIKK